MNKLFVEDKNKIKVPVAELGLILNKEQAILGNFERDLILRTAGNVKIQVGNKFFDLPFNLNENNTSTTISGVIVLDNEFELSTLTYPAEGSLIYAIDTGSFYIALNNSYVKINQSTGTNPDSKIYLSYDDFQTLNGVQKSTVLLNSGYIVNDIRDISNFSINDVYPNQVIFSLTDGKHYQLTDPSSPQSLESWRELYLSKTGGTLSGALIIDSTTESFLQVKGDYLNTYLPITEEQFKGFILGNDYSKGIAFWNNDITTFISSQNLNGGVIQFITNGSSPNPYKPFAISGNSVGVGYIDYNYNFTVGGTSNLVGTSFLTNRFTSKDFITGVEGKGFDLSRDANNKWRLEVDNLFVRNNAALTKKYESTPLDGSLILNFNTTVVEQFEIETITLYANASKVGRYLSDGTELSLANRVNYINVIRIPPLDIDTPTEATTYNLMKLAYGIGDRTSDGNLIPYTLYNKDDNGDLYLPQGNYSYDNVTNEFVENVSGDLISIGEVTLQSIRINNDITKYNIGDLLYYNQWNSDKESIVTYYVEVINILGDELFVYTYNRMSLEIGTVLIKVGNTNIDECLIQLNSADANEPFIEMASNISNFNDFLENVYFDQELIETATQFNKEQLRLKIGTLNNIIDVDLGLALNNQEKGLYSDNVYFKGNFVGNKVIFGTQLNFENDILTIVDLEIIKSRNITGANGLIGGGNLFANDIIISHGTKNWVDKTNLTGNTFISNLVVDAYGHPTNWTTRQITTTDIPEGTNLYYTDARVQTFADTRYALQNGSNATGTWNNNALTADGWNLYQSAIPHSGSFTDIMTFKSGKWGYTPFSDFTASIGLANYALANGSNATGTWGISITGSAFYWGGRPADLNTVNNNIEYVLGRNPDGTVRLTQASGIATFLGLGSLAYRSEVVDAGVSGWSIAQRNANGDIFARYFNTQAGLDETPITDMIGTGGDGYLRRYSKGTLQNWLSLGSFAYRNSILGTEVNTDKSVASWDLEVAKMLRWKNYEDGHVIFDASNGTSPTGTAINNTNAQQPWTATYPTLMGWNGNYTYGVRVDSARTSDLWAGFANSFGDAISDSTITAIPAQYSDGRFYRFSSQALRAFIGSPSTGETLDSVTTRNARTSNSIVTTGYNIRYSDGNFYSGIKSSTSGLGIEYWANITSGDVPVHIFTGYGASELIKIYNTGNTQVSGYLNATRIISGYDSNQDWSVNTASNFRLSGNGGIAWDTYSTAFEGVSTADFKLSTNAGGIALQLWSSGSLRTYLYSDGTDFGFLNSSAGWALRVQNSGDVHANQFHASGWFRSYGNVGWYSETHGGGIYMEDSTWVRVYNGKAFLVENQIRGNDIHATTNGYYVGNYGTGLIGIYSAERYQSVFSMGDAYRPAIDGTSLANSYGIVWTHSNVGGQSKAGLEHQALFTTAGETVTAIGRGIWTIGNVYSAPAPTVPEHLANKAYVDSQSASLWESATATQIKPKDAKAIVATSSSIAQTLLIGNTSSSGRGIRVEAANNQFINTVGTNPTLSVSNIAGSSSIAEFLVSSTPVVTIRTNGTVVATNDIEVSASSKGIILKSPSGNRWRVTISDTGVLSQTLI